MSSSRVTRRTALALAAMGGVGAALPARAQAASRPKELRIGFQRGGILVVAQQQKTLERWLEPLGVTVKWHVFQYSNPLLEAIHAGSIDFGSSGNAPPIFAQAGGLSILYAASQPSGPGGEGIVVRPESGVRSVADLKGKKVAVAKGTSAHYFLVAALDLAKIRYDEITAVYLSPADAPTALSRGDVDAWAVWDPYLALAEKRLNGRVIISLGREIKSNNFLIARRGFAAEHPEFLAQLLAQLATVGSWAEGHRPEMANLLAEITGIELEIQRLAANRATYAIRPISEDIERQQQAVADQFYALKLIPKPVVVKDAIWPVQWA